MTDVTPLRQQYLDIKRNYPDCILMFRLGDFYEMFDGDAEVAARELDLVLTGRPVSKHQRVPMAGVPYHAVDSYIARLIEKGFHVAVCEQVTEPNGKGLVEREVTRVVTPGTVIEPELLNEKHANYLLAIYPLADNGGSWQRAGIAYADISTGEFAATELTGENAAILTLEELARLQPREVLIPQSWAERGMTLPPGMSLTPYADWRFERPHAEGALMQHFKTRSLESFGLAEQSAAICAAGAALQYLRETQKNNLAQIIMLRAYTTGGFMVLDPFTRRNLELTETIRARKTQGSLLGILDRTVTAMGARLLRTWMSQPLLDLKRLNARLDAVEALATQERTRAEIRDALKGVTDLERLTNRLLIGKAGPRDLIALRNSLDAVPGILRMIAPLKPLEALGRMMDGCEDVRELVNRAISDEPPATLNNSGIIRAGFSDELDTLMSDTAHARDWIAALEPTERTRSGIPSLKVGYNKVFGYYIEVSHAHTDKIPSDYIRKQTLVNAERYITPELKDYETLVLNAEEQILAVERRLFDSLCVEIAAQAKRLLETARGIGHLDAFASLADVAVRENYTRPTLSEDDLLLIEDGRHPVVEQLLDGGYRYVPNDTHFDSMSRIHIITGPNMAGKSTYIRQVAIITLLAQIGSFVPAAKATIGLVDRIFARIGAQDEIHAGQSTFMVEMVETARLLSGSTRRSLLILDEVGRGTSTYDGLAIARAVVEYIHNHPGLQCRTLFATHYHELTELPNVLPRARNYNVAIAEEGDGIVFLHKVIAGGADRSYGVHVAQLAGLPRPVVERAKELLTQLEREGSTFEPQAAKRRRENPGQMKMFDEAPNPALEFLKAIKADELSPIEALTKLYELKRLAGGVE